MKEYCIGDDAVTYKAIVGENQAENNQLLQTCEGNDIWFHLDNISGPHIILQTNGQNIKDVHKSYLNKVAGLFPLHKNKLPSRYNVIYTELKNVTLTSTPGLVHTKNTKTIRC